MKSARDLIEEIYAIVLNPTLDYYAQLQPLASYGELASHTSSLQLLCRLCELVDKQAEIIKELREKNVDIEKRLEKRETSLPPQEPVVVEHTTSTLPIVPNDATLTNPTESDTNNPV